MIYIQNGRDRFFQWDLNQRLVVVNEDVKELHFTNALTTEALITEVYELEGMKVADVPNILLQTDWDISVYGGCGECVRETARFKVEPRAKPSDYVYTETDVKNYDALEKRVAALEEAGPGNVDLDDYYTKQETDTKIQEAQPDLSGYALKSEIPDTSSFITAEDIPEVNTATTSSLGVVKPDGTTITITEDGTISSLGNPSDGSIKEWVWVPVNGLNFTLAANTRHLKIVCYIPSDGTASTPDGEEYINNVCIDCMSSAGFQNENRYYLGKVVSNNLTIDPMYIRNTNGEIGFYKRTGYAPYYAAITANDLTVVGYYYWGGSELLTQEDLDSEVNEALEGIENGSY